MTSMGEDSKDALITIASTGSTDQVAVASVSGSDVVPVATNFATGSSDQQVSEPSSGIGAAPAASELATTSSDQQVQEAATSSGYAPAATEPASGLAAAAPEPAPSEQHPAPSTREAAGASTDSTALAQDKVDPAAAEQLLPVRTEALAPGVSALGWAPLQELSADENGLDLALLAARSSKCICGSMGCVVTDPSGCILAVHVNSAIWDPDRERPQSDIHAEINAIGLCARRGVKMDGTTVYVTMPPCRRCFSALAASGVRRMVSRKAHTQKEAKDIARAAKRLGIEVAVVDDTAERRARLDALAAAGRKRGREEE